MTNTLAYNGLSPNLSNIKRNRKIGKIWTETQNGLKEHFFKNRHKNKKDLPETYFLKEKNKQKQEWILEKKILYGIEEQVEDKVQIKRSKHWQSCCSQNFFQSFSRQGCDNYKDIHSNGMVSFVITLHNLYVCSSFISKSGREPKIV